MTSTIAKPARAASATNPIQFLPEHESLNQVLAAHQQASITFKVPNQGPIDMTSRAIVHKGIIRLPGSHRIELLKPNALTPVFMQNSSVAPIQGTFIVTAADAALPGDWTLRVTNLSDFDEDVHVSADVPGTLKTQTSLFPASALDTLVNAVLQQVQIHLDRGENQSFISFPAALGIPEKRFTIDDVQVAPLVVEHPNDINSQSITMALLDGTAQSPNGSVQVTVKFESDDREIKGTLGVEMDNMQLTVSLGLAMLSTAICYNRIDVNFQADINVIGVPDKLVDPILHYKETIKNKVEGAVRNALADFLTCEGISRGLTSAVNKLAGSNNFLADVRVTGGQLAVTFFRPAE